MALDLAGKMFRVDSGAELDGLSIGDYTTVAALAVALIVRARRGTPAHRPAAAYDDAMSTSPYPRRPNPGPK